MSKMHNFFVAIQPHKQHDYQAIADGHGTGSLCCIHSKFFDHTLASHTSWNIKLYAIKAIKKSTWSIEWNYDKMSRDFEI